MDMLGSRLPLGHYLILLVVFSCLSVRGHAMEQLAPRMPIPSRPVTQILPTTNPPHVDGILDDACWDHAVSVRPFTLSYQSAPCPYRAEALFAYTCDALHVALRVFDSDPNEYVVPPYPPANDPCVAEFLIAAGKPETFYKVAVNSRGQVYTTQPMAHALVWHVSPQAAMKRHDNYWAAEWTVPFDALDLPHPGHGRELAPVEWDVNLGWRTPTRIHYAAWAVTHAWFYEPQFYGTLRFGYSEDSSVELLRTEPASPGLNCFPLRISNNSYGTQTYTTLAFLEDRSGRKPVHVATTEVGAKSKQDVVVPLALQDGLRGVLTMEVSENNQPRPIFRQSVVLDLPENRKALNEIQSALDECRRYRELSEKTGRSEERHLRASLKNFTKILNQENVGRKTWLEITRPLRTFQGKAQKLAWKARFTDNIGTRRFVVNTVSSLQKVLKDVPCTEPPTHSITIQAARAETESFQLLIVPFDDLENVDITATPLCGPDGAFIPEDAVQFFWEVFVDARPARYPVEELYSYADALIPLRHARRTVSEDSLHQPIWVSVTVPRNIPAGIYRGTVRVTAPPHETWPIDIILRVYDFELPSVPTLKISMWLNPERIKQWYGWSEIPHGIARQQMAFLLEHRLNPCWFGPIGDEADIEWQLEHGLNCVMLGVAAEWPVPAKMESQIQQWYDFFKKRDLLDMVFIYAQDEPSPQDYPKVRDTMVQVARRWPGVKRMCTAFPPVPELEGAVDIWVVGPNLFHYDAVAERVTAGDDLWLYLSASVRRPYATQLYLDYTALEHRLVGWYCWKYHASGFLYWGINEWESNSVPWSGIPEIDDRIRAGERWPDVPWNSWTYLDCNGDAQYIYPGPDGEFWSSVRLEILRDSFEDYDYLALLENARSRLMAANLPGTDALIEKAKKLLALEPPLISDLTQATSEPRVLLERRDAIAACIEEIQHFLRQEKK